MKRRLQKQGELGPDGEPRLVASRQSARRVQPPRAKNERTSVRQFAKEVRDELRKVAWPTRKETINYSIIVFITLVLFTSLVFCIDWVFSNGVLKLFETS
ncbi:MAG: preprotein translocase subunit SecE [Acidimicrobiales bacterium]|nr:preprotein translocase subunit SecE [Acidimicrobiales bacterium]